MNGIDLDDPEVFKHLDPSGMRNRLRSLPKQCRRGWSKRPTPPLPSHYRRARRILIVGIGGSATVGECLKDLLARAGGPPVEVCRGSWSTLPLDEDTLVIASSYSGNTAETFAAYEEASKHPVMRLALTSGGRLKSRAKIEGIPLYTIDVKSETRSAFGFSFASLLSCVSSLGLVEDMSSQVEEAAAILEEMLADVEEGVPTADNAAKMLAWRLFENLIVVYGSDIFSSVARRWKTQFNENSKAWAFCEVLPEAGHNAVEGFEKPGLIADSSVALLLYSPTLPDSLRLRYEGITDLLKKAGVAHQIVEAKGVGPLAQMMSLVLLGDYASYYLGILYGKDPSPVPSIDKLKRLLLDAEISPEPPL